MKTKDILTVLAVVVTAIAQPVLAEFIQDKNGEITHVNGIPLPPMQTVEEARAQAQKEIAAAKKACEAAQAVNNQPATRNASPATSPQEVFYTGKPLIEETGQYAFLFRSYDPELGRWTTADPSGFPDGANNLAYMAVPTTQFDWQGLKIVTVAHIEAQSWTNEFNWLEAGAGAAGSVIGLLTAPSGWGAAVGLTGAGLLVAELGDWRDNGVITTYIPGEVPDPYRFESMTETNQSYRFDVHSLSPTVVMVTLTWTATYDWNGVE